jgi:hypothetical protein
MKFFCRQLYFATIPLLKMFYQTSGNEQYASENTGNTVVRSVIKKTLNFIPFLQSTCYLFVWTRTCEHAQIFQKYFKLNGRHFNFTVTAPHMLALHIHKLHLNMTP